MSSPRILTERQRIMKNKRNRDYHAKHREERNAKNRERMKIYNKETKYKAQKEYYKRNKDKINAYRRLKNQSK